MSAPNSMVQQNLLSQMSKSAATSCQQEARAMAPESKQLDLIESKFNQLAKKILNELQQAQTSHEFFMALDLILQEPNKRINSMKQRQTTNKTTRSTKQLQLSAELARKCDILLAKQKMQQDQLDSHQQILFDSQYKSLPIEIRGRRVEKSASELMHRKQEQSKVGAQVEQQQPTGTSIVSPTQKVRASAIPTSTILSGINQLSKSATTGSFASSHSKEPTKKVATQAAVVVPAQLTNEKLKQRRPTKANISIETDENNADEDEDDDNSYDFKSLASRRAYLNERFIQPAAAQPVVKSKTFSDTKLVNGPQNLASVPAKPLVAASVMRSRTIQAPTNQQQPHSLNVMMNAKRFEDEDEDEDDEDDDEDDDDDDFDDSEGPRAINGLLTSQSGNIGMSYKPHMNYSQSLLGNHRLSDDDEIIIIPTVQSPSPLLLSASPSPINMGRQQQQANTSDEPGNLDEFNERFSISRTKSFWEKLASSKKSGTTGETNITANQQQQGNEATNNSQQQQQKVIHHQHSTIKSAFDRLDSTGNSGNSHMSGCSSSSSQSGDETQQAYQKRMQQQQQRHVVQQSGLKSQMTTRHQPQQQQQPSNVGNVTQKMAQNRNINHLVHQEQLQRTDRFRRTR